MQAQHLTDFPPFLLVTVPTREALELSRRRGVWLGQHPAGNLRPQSIEEVDQGFEIVVHISLNAPTLRSCGISSEKCRPIPAAAQTPGHHASGGSPFPPMLKKQMKAQIFCKIDNLARLSLGSSSPFGHRRFYKRTDGR